MTSISTDRPTIPEKVRWMLGKHSADGMPSSRMNESRLKEDLGFDSLDRLALALDLEAEFEIRLSDADIDAWLLVHDLIRCVETKVAQDKGRSI